jgi:hypothetical protein
MRKALLAAGLSKINSGYELANNKGEIINKFIRMARTVSILSVCTIYQIYTSNNDKLGVTDWLPLYVFSSVIS